MMGLYASLGLLFSESLVINGKHCYNNIGFDMLKALLTEMMRRIH